MNEDELLELWRTDRPMYEAWGDCVVKEIVKGVQGKVSPVSADLFLRIPPKHRLKEDVSIVEKAFYRKTYSDPYFQITDKVGVRFVVLLASDLKVVEDAIAESKLWNASKDRDFEQEQKSNPIQFDYQAIHYVVRCKGDQQFGDLAIRDGSPCEVQVKTLLQHAYSELTHDTIYKPRVDATPEMKRAAAKSMALIEATNDYFEDVTRKVIEVTAPERALTNSLKPLYQKITSNEPHVSRLEGLLLDALGSIDHAELMGGVKNMLDTSPFIGKCVADRASAKLLFRQPSILAVYYLVQNHSTDLRQLWPLTDEELRPIFIDLGIAFD